ncbi:CRISPR-associated protein, Cas1 family [Izhakiella capsodis]|uniref:CRISPR-associated endonuclease Cas1 n=1 Tax=Izhakiella capsodis TaxID=1367852 RepID=A0A1I4WV71_9GAMM|nr:type I-F CRISPR-associated endonuclease Cas1f [Izhakiella capsodis]SFN17282.1 CRISPR-associated protein, Cas1 family [Izhakiella capsodis]
MGTEDVRPSDLKTILHSKRANIYYLQHCRVLVKGGRVEYVTEQGKESLYWNIPIANTTVVLLGTGTSVTQLAMREFARAGVMVGFCGGGGTPLYAANEYDVAVSWLSPQSEYRPTDYFQKWVSFWFKEKLRLKAAKSFQSVRINQIEMHWHCLASKSENNVKLDRTRLNTLLAQARENMSSASTHNQLMLEEARLTKALYKIMAQSVGYGDFTRAKRGGGSDMANRFLDHGNYLAYGLAAVAAWVNGLPHSLAVMHGKTRRGGLVFDIADLIKDALILPRAFIAAMAGEEEQAFRQRCMAAFQQCESLDLMITTLQDVAEEHGQADLS